MLVKRNSTIKTHISLFTLAAAILALLLTAGCAGGNYGTLDRDRELDTMFVNYEVLPDHRYYTSGGYDWPSAILAVHRDYELIDSGNLWRSVPNVDSGQLRKWMSSISPAANYRYSNAYFAAYILDPNGKRVGAWFAIENQTTVKFFEENKILVYPPQMIQDFNFRRGLMFRNDL